MYQVKTKLQSFRALIITPTSTAVTYSIAKLNCVFFFYIILFIYFQNAEFKNLRVSVSNSNRLSK